jgi:pyrroloquinoline quinone biosynthesis protein E
MVLNFVLHRQNIHQTKEMLELALSLKADYVELATVQYYGWALHNRTQLLPSKQQLDQAEAIAHDYQKQYNDKMKIIYVIPDYYEGKPNIATSVFFITF